MINPLNIEHINRNNISYHSMLTDNKDLFFKLFDAQDQKNIPILAKDIDDLISNLQCKGLDDHDLEKTIKRSIFH